MSNPKVHIVVPHFQAITEFAGHNDDCGPCANQVCAACCEGRPPTTDGMNAMRARDLAAGKFRDGEGQRLDEVAWDVAQFTSPKIETTVTPFGSPAETIHNALRSALGRGNPCVLNLALAGSLPGNQSGIHYHFVAVGGVDTALGYLIANGDEYPFGRIGTYWVSWNGILAAQPCGLIEYHMPPKPVQPAQPPDYEALYKAELAKVTAARAALA